MYGLAISWQQLIFSDDENKHSVARRLIQNIYTVKLYLFGDGNFTRTLIKFSENFTRT